MFPAATFQSRRERLRQQLSSGVLLFLGNQESPMNYAANTYHFRQDSTFLYYFGIDDPGLAAVMDLDEGREIVFGDELTIDDIVWTGFLPTVAERAARVGVAETRPVAALAEYLAAATEVGRTAHFLPPYRGENKIALLDLLGVQPEQAESAASLDFIRAVVEMRAVKSDEEIAEIESAVDTSTEMHLAAMRMIRPGMTENDVAARVTEIALAAGGNLSFPVIATIRGETLHNHYHGNTVADGDLFLLDCGAETARRYAGDLTSTFPVGSRFTSRQRDVYSVVLETHKKAVEALKPGVRFRDVHLLACRTLAEGMKGLGLMKGNLDDAIAEGAHAMFFQCGLGHMMGMDVHDMEDLGEVWVGYEGRPKSTQFGLKSLRLARELKEGFVFTVEPGAYFIPQLIDLWRDAGAFTEYIDYDRLEEYRDFGGIRIEEDFVMTSSGGRLLGTQAKPKEIDDVEAQRA